MIFGGMALCHQFRERIECSETGVIVKRMRNPDECYPAFVTCGDMSAMDDACAAHRHGLNMHGVFAMINDVEWTEADEVGAVTVYG